MRSTREKQLAAALGAVAAAGGLYLTGRAAIRLALRARLRGRVVMIVGGTRGLGLAMARRFVDLGCPVAICGRDLDTAERARADLVARGGTVVAGSCDATDEADVARFLDVVLANLGRVDVLVTTAATVDVGPLEALTTRDFQEAMESTFWSNVHPTLAVLPIMRGQGHGRIAHVTSIGGRIPVPHLLPYSSAKFALVGFSEGLRSEVAKDGIEVTTIVPGLMRTGSYLFARFVGDAAREQAWFGRAATTPVLSMDADRAAARMIDAIAAGSPRAIIGLPARVAVAGHALFPRTSRRALRLTERALPAAPRDGERMETKAGEIDLEAVRAVQRAGADEAARYQHLGAWETAPD